MTLIGKCIVVSVGRQPGYYSVFEVDTGTYYAWPAPGIKNATYGPDHKEFYFAKVGNTWKSDPLVPELTLAEVVQVVTKK